MNDFQAWVNSDTSVSIKDGYIRINGFAGEISLPISTFKHLVALLQERGQL